MTSGILFDVDGTLVDSTYVHTLCWHDALRSANHLIPMNVLHRAIGMGAPELLGHVLGDASDEATIEEISRAHRVLYQRHWARLTALPGAVGLLRSCSAAGHRIVLATSAAEAELAAMRRVLDTDDVIDASTCSSDVDRTKPEPDVIKVALAKGALSAESSLFVGDSVSDAVACRRAGVGFIGLSCGGTGEHELRQVGAIEVWRDPADLLANLRSSAIAHLNTFPA